jgi:NAD(P)-dependent dehydrogenase (short-subunit alcohol dehydrogenase family)
MIRPAVIVTGAARGIGAAIARALASGGFDLVLGDVDDPGTTAAACEEAGAGTVSAIGSVADEAIRKRLVATALERFGRLDGLVNNAGVSVMAVGDILDVSAESYDRCAAINTRSVFFLTQRVCRHFVGLPPDDTFRFVVTITSSNAVAVSPTRAEYCVSKAASSMVTKLFAVRMAAHGVGVFEIRPGVIETDMTAPRIAGFRERIANEGLAAIPRTGRTDDVAACVLTLAKGGLPYTVGQAIEVDGGLVMRRY